MESITISISNEHMTLILFFSPYFRQCDIFRTWEWFSYELEWYRCRYALWCPV